MFSNINVNMSYCLLTFVIALVTFFYVTQTHNDFCCNSNDANEEISSGLTLFGANNQFNHFLWINNHYYKLDIESDREIFLKSIPDNYDIKIFDWFYNLNNNSHNFAFSGYYSNQLYFVGLFDKTKDFIRFGLFDLNSGTVEPNSEYILPFSRVSFNPSLAYYPFTYTDKHVQSVLFIEQILIGDYDYERRIQTYDFSQAIVGKINNQTAKFDHDIPRFISHLDKSLYIIAIFPQISSILAAKTALPLSVAIVIVKHENIVKYCITFENIFDDSCNPLNLKSLNYDYDSHMDEIKSEELSESNAIFITMAVIGSVVIVLIIIGVVAYFYFTRFKKQKDSNESIDSNETVCKI